MGFILYLISEILMFIAKPVVWCYSVYQRGNSALKRFDNKCLVKAIANDKLSNSIDSALLTKLFITPDSNHAFGNPNETISSVLGKNLLAKTLTKKGYEICKLLDDIQPNHVIISINDNIF